MPLHCASMHAGEASRSLHAVGERDSAMEDAEVSEGDYIRCRVRTPAWHARSQSHRRVAEDDVRAQSRLLGWPHLP